MPLFNFDIQYLKSLGVAVGDDDRLLHEAGHGFVATGEGIYEQEFGFVGVAGHERLHESDGGRLIFCVGVLSSLHGDAEDGFPALFLELLELLYGQVGVDKVFGSVVDLGFLIGQFQEGGNHFVGVSESG